MNLPFLAALTGITGAWVGAYLPIAHGRTRLLVPVSGAILLAVSLFAILPEIASESGWLRAAALYIVGYLLLFALDRYIHPVCPACSHDHDHGHCATELHGFSIPLIAATSLHSLVDGWSMTVAQGARNGIVFAIPVAILLHKIPEGLALGVMLRAALKTRTAAAAWGTAAESCTALGAILAVAVLPGVGPEWGRDLLAVAGGTFLFLGFHAIHGVIGKRA